MLTEPVTEVFIENNQIKTWYMQDGKEYSFDIIYSALGIISRTELVIGLGAKHNKQDCLLVNEHQQTSVTHLYAAGDIVQGLNQICVATAQGAIAAVHVHNTL